MNPFFGPSTLVAFQGSFPDALKALGALGPLIPVFIIFYLLLILPMQRQRKALQKVIANLKKGDRVITSGGIYGEVSAVDGITVILRIADNVRVKVAKTAISGVEGESSEKGSTS